MDHDNLKKVKLNIHGMHCTSCAVLIERKFKQVNGVQRVNVSHASGTAELLCVKEPELDELNALIQSDGYHVSLWQDRSHGAQSGEHKNTWKDYLQIGGMFLVIVSAYSLLQQFHLVPSVGISQHMSYGVIFLIGVFAALSTCIAVVGGLLLALAGKYNELHPDLTGIQKFQPHIFFNAGRIVGYTVFGAAVGGLGSVLTLSARANGAMIIFVSVVMLILGFQLLHLFPWMKRFSPSMPKFLGHKIHDLSTKDSNSAPFMLGAATFFLPCGFTQALQLYVLASGDWKVGALTMLTFSLGTLPALLSLSAVSSFAKGAFQRHFLRFAGVLVVTIAISNINNGLTLAGYDLNLASVFETAAQARASEAPIIDGKQVVTMTVNGYTYSPHQFTVAQGIPVEWQIDGGSAVGCGQVLVMPTLGITQYLSPEKTTTITFTPTATGTIPFNCSMGMMTSGSAFTVVPNTTGIVAAGGTAQTNATVPPCDPAVMDCIEPQKIAIEVSKERGVSAKSLTVKMGLPVELTIDDKTPLGGCMSVWVIPKYNITIPMNGSVSKITFTPTETGPVKITCSMGSTMAQINVTE